MVVDKLISTPGKKLLTLWICEGIYGPDLVVIGITCRKDTANIECYVQRKDFTSMPTLRFPIGMYYELVARINGWSVASLS